mgnify:CR=1 FL=1
MTITIALFPAHAGVIPSRSFGRRMPNTFPRTRGGDPELALQFFQMGFFSLHTRG